MQRSALCPLDWDAKNKIVVIYPTSDIGEPGYSNAIQQAQLNAATPEQVQKLESALGITMEGSAAGGGWGYNPSLNADGSPNVAFISQNMTNSFVVASYEPGDDEVDVFIECVTMVSDPSTVSWDISPLQNVLATFFPGQDADIQQLMTAAQQGVANAIKYHGCNKLPGDILTINGVRVAIGQSNRLTFASMVILGS